MKEGETRNIRGLNLTLLHRESLNHLGSSFWGKYHFYLRDNKGGYYSIFGKVINHNATVFPCKPHNIEHLRKIGKAT